MDEQRVPSADQGGKTRRTEPGAGWSPSCHSVGRAEKLRRESPGKAAGTVTVDHTQTYCACN